MGSLETSTDWEEHTIGEILDRTCDVATGEKTSVRRTVQSLGRVSNSALALFPAVLIVTPLSGIPGMPTIAGLIIGLVSMQGMLGRDHLWLPDWILRREVDTGKLTNAIGYLRGPARFVDRYTQRRLPLLVRPPLRTALQATCMICGFAMPLLELVPFSSSVVGAAIALLLTALLSQDGLLAAIGLALIAAAGVTVSLALG